MKRILIIATFLACTGQSFGQDAAQMPNQSTKIGNIGTLAGLSWNGWGADLSNTRFQPERLSLSQLKLKWEFGFPGAKASQANR
jgi:polyvinyl alcohol dehydrogenase (cytochrome)